MSFVRVAKGNPLQAAGQEMLSRFVGLAEAQMVAKPVVGWNRLQVVDHMVLAYGGTTAELERRLEKGSPTAKPRTLRNRVAQFMVVGCAYFPPGRKAPGMVDPELHELPAMDGAALAAVYRDKLSRLDEAITRAEQAWGSRVAVAVHPVLGPLNAPQWRRFHAIHTMHHCGQMDRIARSLNR